MESQFPSQLLDDLSCYSGEIQSENGAGIDSNSNDKNTVHADSTCVELIFFFFFLKTIQIVHRFRESIVRHLGIPDGLKGVISDVPLPDNLLLTISKDENRDAELLALLRSDEFINNRSIIIYCGRRDECNRVADYIRTCMQVTASSCARSRSIP